MSDKRITNSELLDAIKDRNYRFDKLEDKINRMDKELTKKVTNHGTNINWIKAVLGSFISVTILGKVFKIF